MEKYKILKDLVSINTINDKENDKFIKYVSSVLESKGFNIDLIKFKDNKKCLVAKSKSKCNLCFMGHSDTVCYNDGWLTNPFILTVKNEYLYGLGACDMKGGIAAFLETLNSIDVKTLKCGIMVIITYDEEINFEGIMNFKDYKGMPNNIIIGEPTDNVPIISCKGCLEFKTTLNGLSVHSSEMIKGDNAILKCFRYINELEKYFETLKLEKNNNFDIPFTTMNIAKIIGGNAINIVPDKVELLYDFRTVFPRQNKEILKFITSLSQKYNCITETLNNVLPKINENEKDISFIQSITGKKPKGANYVTEGNFLDKNNIMILGPGPVTAHQVNEHISIASYNKTIKLYKKIIEYYCS